MKGIATAAQIVVRVTFVVQIVLGVAFWTGHLLTLLNLHIASGILLVLGLWVLAALGARSGAPLGIVVLAVAWGLVVILFGLNQGLLLTGNWHWTIQVLHLLVGVAAIGQAEALAARIKRSEPAPAPISSS
jgi:hypothetical protein